MASKKYIRVSKGFTNYKLFPIDTDVDTIIQHDPESDYYQGIYYYNEEQYNKWQETKTVRGFAGVITNKLIFDFDEKPKDNLTIEHAREDATRLIARLIRLGVPRNSIPIYFSGNKGFSVEVQIDKELKEAEFKNIVKNLASDLKTFDETIHDAQRLLRIPLTKHQVSKLYKIPLTMDQLSETPLDMIKDWAQGRTDINDGLIESWGTITIPNAIYDLKDKTYEEQKKEIPSVIKDPTDINWNDRPTWMPACKYALSHGFFVEGFRDYSFIALAATYKAQGFPKEVVFNMLRAIADIQASRNGTKRFSDIELKKKVEQVFSREWKGGTYSCRTVDWLHTYCESLGDHACSHNYHGKAFQSNDEMHNKFRNYILNIEKNTIKTGVFAIDENVRLTVGMPVGLLGGPSAGKSTLALNILRNASKNGTHCLFFSMDMYGPIIYQKQIHMVTGKNASTIIRDIANPKKDEEYRKLVKREFPNVEYCTWSGLTADEIKEQIIQYKKDTGNDVKLVIIDYLECIQGQYADPTTNTAIIANKLKDIATGLNLCVIVLLQPQKSSGGASQPLTNMYQIKGASTLAQAFRVVLGIYREGFTPDSYEDDKWITVVGLKNTMGPLFKVDCRWNGLTGEIKRLTGFDEKELYNFRKRKEKEDSEKDPFS